MRIQEGRVRPFAGAVISIAAGLLLGGFTTAPSTLGESVFCSNLRTLRGAFAQKYEQCCLEPPERREACFDALRTDDAYALILQAKLASENGDVDLAKDSMKRLRDILHPGQRLEAGRTLNDLVAFGHADWLELDVTLTRNPADCHAVENRGAAGLGEQGVSGGPVSNTRGTGSSGAAHGDHGADDTSASARLMSCSFDIPDGATVSMRFGEEVSGIALAGWVSIARTQQRLPTEGSAVVAIPTEANFDLAKSGQRLSMHLDSTSPHNHVTLDSAGRGTLCVALTIASDSPWLAGLVQVGSTLYFSFPIEVSADWSTIRVRCDRTTPADEITPTVAVALQGADSPGTLTRVSDDRCSDGDGDGLRDGAEELSHAMASGFGCKTGH